MAPNKKLLKYSEFISESMFNYLDQLSEIVEDFLSVRLDFAIPETEKVNLYWDIYTQYDGKSPNGIIFKMDHRDYEKTEFLNQSDLDDLQIIIDKQADGVYKVAEFMQQLSNDQYIMITDEDTFLKLRLLDSIFEVIMDHTEKIMNDIFSDKIQIVNDVVSRYRMTDLEFTKLISNIEYEHVDIASLEWSFPNELHKFSDGTIDIDISFNDGRVSVKCDMNDDVKDIYDKIYDTIKNNELLYESLKYTITGNK